ncbi:chalcone isomerase family protein [Roseovarius sp. CAU 1744]|uniref:chalcone isomerase family protein n=1 Tax=Roseovarius sp. CAU 1744 TaxID=3140368 RepID=UPI00325C2CAD
MPRWVLIACLVLAVLPARATEGPALIARMFDTPALRGEATFRWLGVPLYTARFFTPDGQALSWQKPAALQLIYARDFSRQSLVDATMSELERMEGTRADHAELAQKLVPCFRDVGEGDQFVAIATTTDEVQLYFNGAPTCQLRHAEINARFLGIWLSDNSRAPELSRRLRGG